MFVLTADQTATLSVQPVDKNGNPAPINGEPTWSTADTTIATVVAQPDQGDGIYRASLTPGTSVGETQVNVSADADLGPGVTEIYGVLDLQVVGGQAIGFQIAATVDPAKKQQPQNPS